jgi:C4-dicarboxylate transporter
MTAPSSLSVTLFGHVTELGVRESSATSAAAKKALMARISPGSRRRAMAAELLNLIRCRVQTRAVKLMLAGHLSAYQAKIRCFRRGFANQSAFADHEDPVGEFQ